MKVAFTSTGSSMDSEIDPRFGRAQKFVIVDTENGNYEAIDNSQNLNAAQGAGIQAAQNVASKSVEAVVTVHCGPKAFTTLSAAGIAVYTGASGTIRDVLAAFKDGKLQQTEGADVQGHWM